MWEPIPLSSSGWYWASVFVPYRAGFAATLWARRRADG